ncbi:hypothetical protein AB0D97_01625 [Streptomyces roseus]|uniref:hypothetical protein n=1 Tax=Streptomyces roseus TaxID=66430 RepID=UPI0033E4AC5A
MGMPETHTGPAARAGSRARLSTGSELAFTGQCVVAGAVFLATSGMRDDHGLGIDSSVLAALPLMSLVVVLAAYLHRLLFTLPVMALTRALGKPWSAPLWGGGVAAAYAGLAAAAWDLPYGWALLWTAGPGVLPLVAASLVAPAGVWDGCSGTGTWTFERGRESGGLFDRARDRVTLRIEGCGPLRDWQAAGTAERPELFCVMGDPDDLHPRYAETLHRL